MIGWKKGVLWGSESYFLRKAVHLTSEGWYGYVSSSYIIPPWTEAWTEGCGCCPESRAISNMLEFNKRHSLLPSSHHFAGCMNCGPQSPQQLLLVYHPLYPHPSHFGIENDGLIISCYKIRSCSIIRTCLIIQYLPYKRHANMASYLNHSRTTKHKRLIFFIRVKDLKSWN